MRTRLFLLSAILYTTALFGDDSYYRELEKKASNGDAYAQNEMGDACLNGNGLKQDYAGALKWFKRAAEQKNSEAYYQLGNIYLNGLGTPVNNTEALKWFKLAAESDHTEAQRQLATMYQYGINGVEKDLKEAVKWYEKITRGYGNNSVKVSLADIYYEIKDYTKALAVYKQMMEESEPFIPAAAKLSEMYYNGYGTKPDYEESYFYWTICKKYNMQIDKKISFNGKIKPDEIKKIEARAAELINRYERNMGRGGGDE